MDGLAILYQFTQFFQCKKHARFDRRNRPSRDSRDLFVAELLVNSQFDNGLLLRWQVLHHAPEVFTLLLFLQLRVHQWPDTGHVLGNLDEFMGLLLHMIDAMIDCNPIKPRLQAGFPPETGKVFESFDRSEERRVGKECRSQWWRCD